MANRFGTSLVIVVLLVAITGCATDGNSVTPSSSSPQNTAGKSEASQSDSATVDRVVKAIWNALTDTKRNMIAGYDLESVTVTLQTTTVETASGNLELVVKMAGSKEWTTGEQLTVKLVPPTSGETNVASDDDYVRLRNALLAAARAGRVARDAATPNLDVSSYGTEVSFAVKRSRTGGAKLEFAPINIGGEVANANTATHKINVTFKQVGN